MGCVQSLLKTDADLETLYTLGKCVGEGVEGQVYLATPAGVEDGSAPPVAIKLVERGEDLGLGPEKVRREIQLQARLSHVNIVELKQVILTRRHLAIVMGYEGGGDLHAYCSKYTLNEEVARYFFRQIVQGLSYCHRSHIAHRDLKLSNFLLTTDKPMRVKLCDFGCARHWDTGKKVPEKRLGRFTTFAGTPAYMSPQVLQSAFYPTNTYDAVEADVWALGIVLTHMFFGRHTPFWLEANAFRNEASTMSARIEAMKQQNWVDSDEFVKANVTQLSPELRDLLDKIFVADEFKRITMQGIMEHPWYTKELPPFLQNALDEMDREQALRDSLARATVSVAANRHDTAMRDTGDFATIDLLVDLAQKHRTMPGGSGEHAFCLDMAHMELGPLSHANSVTESILSASAIAETAAAAAAGGKAGDASVHSTSVYAHAPAGSSVAWDGGTDGGEGTQHSAISYSSLDRVAATGDRSYHYSTSGGGGAAGGGSGGGGVGSSGGGASEACGPAVALSSASASARYKRTLNLRKLPDSGLVVGAYTLEAVSPRSLSARSGTFGSSGGGAASAGSWLASRGAAARAARSVHGGHAFFNAATGLPEEEAGKGEGSSSVRRRASGVPAYRANKTVHGGTEWAATKQPKAGGIFFYQQGG